MTAKTAARWDSPALVTTCLRARNHPAALNHSPAERRPPGRRDNGFLRDFDVADFSSIESLSSFFLAVNGAVSNRSSEEQCNLLV